MVITYALPIQFFEHIQTFTYVNSHSYRVASSVLFFVALITLICFPFRMHLPAVVAGSTAITAVLFIIGQIVFNSDKSIGLGIFAFSLFHGLINIRVGSLYGEDISTTKESSNIHLSQAVEFLVLYVMMMIKLLPIQILREIGLFMLRRLHAEKPILDQLIMDFSQLFKNFIESIF